MPKYFENLIHKTQHNTITPSYSPFKWSPPSYGQRVQHTKLEDTFPPLDKKGRIYVQWVLGSLLYYARAVEPIMLVALNKLPAEQDNPTQNTIPKIK